MLHLHRSTRADGLLDALGSLLAEPPDDPFAPEVISVPTRGMERWIAQQLSSRLGTAPGATDGVCANVVFPTPRRLVGDAVAAAVGVDPDTDPWLPERSVWPLLSVVDDCLDEPWIRLLAAHLGGDPQTADPLKRARRFATVRHVADLYDGYALHRPDMVREWAASRPAADEEWQGQLWRCLRARIDEPSPAERLVQACAALVDDPGLVDLPPRLSIFGLTRVPVGYRDVLAALAARRDVHLFLLHPSPGLWEAVAANGAQPTRRKDDPTAGLATNRLLGSWGRDSREMQLVLSAAEHVDHEHPVEPPADTLLRRIQADVREDRTPTEPLPLDAGDRSVEIHACHGRARQVEVLRDAILHVLEDDPALEPRDVIVMCPDIETFAPLVHATFGAAAPDEDDDAPEPAAAPDLRVRLADRALRQTNPVLGVVSALLELADDRVTASQVLDLAGREPVRRRFGLDDDDLARLEEWAGESGIRWGLDAEHRASFKLERVEEGTWARGLERVLAGVTMTEDDRRLIDGVLPLDDVDSSAIDLAGRLAELVDRLHETLDALAAPKTVPRWIEAIARAADLLAGTTERDAWQRTELDRLLADVADEAAAAGDLTLALAEIRALLRERLQGRPTRANFRTGHLTFCTLVPMRSIPHRVVCLLGLDDAVFPRKAPRDGDDLRLDDPRIGERDPRSEDRQLLLDAVMAAGDRLLVTYTGNDERTNAERPPAVPVGELLDVIERMAGSPARDAVVVHHPLQPFDPRNFKPGELAGADPWSFDRTTLAGARKLTVERPARPPFLAAPLEPVTSPVVELDDLVRFVQHPVRAFLRERLGLSLGDWSTEVEDELPIELDGLERWEIGQRMLDARLEGSDGRAVCLAEIARGHLPPGVLGRPVLAELFDTVQGIVGQAEKLLGDDVATAKDVRVALHDGRVLTGTVGGLRGDALRTTTFSRVAAKHRLTAWVRLVAITAADPETEWQAVTIGRGSDDSVAVATITSLGATAEERRATALEHLATLADLHDRAVREPLPMACKTSAAYAVARVRGGDERRAAGAKWETDRFAPEAEEPEHVLAFGRRDFDDLIGEPPRDDERGLGWDASEPSRLGRYAMRLWAPLLAIEELREL